MVVLTKALPVNEIQSLRFMIIGSSTEKQI